MGNLQQESLHQVVGGVNDQVLDEPELTGLTDASENTTRLRVSVEAASVALSLTADVCDASQESSCINRKELVVLGHDDPETSQILDEIIQSNHRYRVVFGLVGDLVLSDFEKQTLINLVDEGGTPQLCGKITPSAGLTAVGRSGKLKSLKKKLNTTELSTYMMSSGQKGGARHWLEIGELLLNEDVFNSRVVNPDHDQMDTSKLVETTPNDEEYRAYISALNDYELKNKPPLTPSLYIRGLATDQEKLVAEFLFGRQFQFEQYDLGDVYVASSLVRNLASATRRIFKDLVSNDSLRKYISSERVKVLQDQLRELVDEREPNEVLSRSRTSIGIQLLANEFNDRRPEWSAKGACNGTDPELFYPDSEEATTNEIDEITRQSQKICLRCPVGALCLKYAIDEREKIGIWGGMTEQERRSISRAYSTLLGSGNPKKLTHLTKRKWPARDIFLKFYDGVMHEFEQDQKAKQKATKTQTEEVA